MTVEEFSELARRYCSTIEGARSKDASEIFRILLRVMAGAADLAATDPTSDQPAPTPAALTNDARNASSGLLAMLGNRDLYYEVLDQRIDGQPAAGSLTDDLVEIYLDLGRGLAVYDLGDEIDASWEWKFSFETHWGRHATSATRVLHQIVFE